MRFTQGRENLATNDTNSHRRNEEALSQSKPITSHAIRAIRGQVFSHCLNRSCLSRERCDPLRPVVSSLSF